MSRSEQPGPVPVLVHLVGPLRAERAGTALTAAGIGSRKGRTLLRLLAARRGDLLDAAEITGALWPSGAPPTHPEAVVASLVSRLRGVLGGEVVLGGREGYRLGAVDTDVDRARRLLDAADGEPAAVAIAAARSAADLLGTGEALPEEDAGWAAAVRAEVTSLRRRARRSVARAALEGGDPAAAEEAARSAVEEDPLDEESGRLLMRAQLARGAPADALRTYDRLRRALAEELGTDPAPGTRDLHAAALRGEPPPPAPAAGVARVAERFDVAGRQEELAAVGAAWEGACAHRAGLVVLSGEPGIGKSRLLEELAGLAGRTGGTVLVGRSYEGERSLFAQPVVDALAAAVGAVPAERLRRAAAGEGLLGRLVPDLEPFTGAPPPVPASSAVEGSQAVAAVAAFLRGLAQEGPVLLVVDDLQRAGRSTVELLHYLARHLRRAQLLLAAAVRTGEGDPEGDDVLELLGGVAETVHVGPLPPIAVSLLAARAGHEARAGEVVRRTGGHPLFVLEVLRALTRGETGLPPSLRAAVVDRVRRTGEGTELLLRAAAVLGAAFDPAAAAGVAGVPVATGLRAAERALGAGLLLAAGAQYEFAHDVVREALLATTPSPTLLAWHARAADLLADEPEAVAAHAEAVGDMSRAARAWLLAAEQALGRFVASDAVALAGRALTTATALGEPELEGRALLVRGRAQDAAARFPAAFADLTAARAASRAAGDLRLQMTVLRELAGDVPVALGHPPADCEPLLREGLVLAERLGDRGMAADVLDRLTVLRCSRLDFTDARALARLSLTAGRAAEDPHALARGLDAVKTSSAYLGRADELGPAVAELEPLLRRLGDLWMLQWTLFEGAFVPLAAGDDAAALARIGEARDVCRRSGYTPQEPFFLAHAGWVHRLSGRLDEAEAVGRWAVELAARHRHTWWSTTAAALFAGTLLAVGRPAAAAEVLRPAVRVADVPGAEAYLLRCLAPLAEATGEESVLHRADGLLRSIRVPDGAAWLLGADAYLGVARAWQAAGRPERGAEILTGFRAAALGAGWSALASAAG